MGIYTFRYKYTRLGLGCKKKIVFSFRWESTFQGKTGPWAPNRYVIIDPNTCLGLTSIS